MKTTHSIVTRKVAFSAILTSAILAACTSPQTTSQVIDNKNKAENSLGDNVSLVTVPMVEPLPENEMLVSERDDSPMQGQLQDTSVSDNERKKAYLVKRSHLMQSELMIMPAAAYAGKSLNLIRAPGEPLDRENYDHFDDNQIKLVAESPVSTFSIDVDTGSYSNVRRMINAGKLPREDAVRVEELVNYFSYDYPVPENNETPFSVTTEIGVNPWNPESRLLHIGIKGYDITAKELPASNLVFLIDVSGSMNSPDKLGLLKSSLKLLTKKMRDEDRVSIVVYAGASGIVLEPTPGNQSAKIVQALASLSAGGSTNGAAGIRSAYLLAEQEFIKGGINRIILATDGDFNVGTVNFEALKDLVEEKRKSGVSLTTLGFGSGNYNDHLMEQLADAGNGNYSYIDTLNEAQKVLVDEMSSTFNTIAKDVKIQIEFNPSVVAEYRLIGYENRALNREDFNNDKVDAGEIGAGHTITALYEVTLVDSENRAVDPLRYSNNKESDASYSTELAHLRLRFKEPVASKSKLIEQVIKTSDMVSSITESSDSYRFSASVAGFAQLLRGGKFTKDFAFDDVLELARKSRGDDNFGYRGEFISLVNLANSLSSQTNDDLQASR